MNLILSYCKVFTKGLKLTLVALVLLPVLGKAQASKSNKHIPVRQASQVTIPYQGNGLRTTGTATCPVNPTIVAQDTLGNTINNHAHICQSATPFYVFPQQATDFFGNPIGGVPGPCLGTLYTNFSNSLGLLGTEVFLQGGVPIYTICPSCPNGDSIGYGNGTAGSPWTFELYNLDTTQSVKVAICGAGAINTTTLSLVDCWTGNQLSSTPTSTVFTGASCDTLTLAPNTSMGTGMYTIAPATGSVALTYYGGGGILVQPSSLTPGTYTVNYTFTPPSADGCTAVTGNFKFTITASPTITVAGTQTICPGSTTTLTATSTAGAGTNFTWTPSGTLSAATGSVVTASPTVTTTYTITGVRGGGCSGTDTIRINVIPVTFSVNSATVCSGGNAVKLIASNSALTYTWAPAAGATISANTDTALVNPTSTTVYTITGGNGSCPPITITDSVKVVASPTIAVLSPTVCIGTTATITATGATSYTWFSIN